MVVAGLLVAVARREGVNMNPHDRFAAASGAIVLALAVALGAFGAHGLQAILSEARLATFETAVRYQFFHGLGLLAVGALRLQAGVASRTMLAGVSIFAGALYIIVAGGPSWFGIVAPIGGALMVLSWVLVFFAVRNARGA